MTVSTVDAGRRRIARQVEIAAPPDALFTLVADPRRHHELDGSGTVGSTIAGPDRLSEGATFSVNMKQMGMPYRIKSTVVAFDENHVVAWRHPLGHTWRWEFEETTPGHTLVTETFDYSTAKAPWGLEISGVPRRNAAGITRTLEQLRDRFTN